MEAVSEGVVLWICPFFSSRFFLFFLRFFVKKGKREGVKHKRCLTQRGGGKGKEGEKVERSEVKRRREGGKKGWGERGGMGISGQAKRIKTPDRYYGILLSGVKLMDSLSINYVFTDIFGFL